MQRVLAAMGMVMWMSAGPCWAEAAVGQRAPDFTLTDTNEQTHSLSQYQGGFVVLEWSNHECPFVRKHYGSGNMQKLQETYTGKGVVLLTIVSSAPGKQGYVTPEQANAIRRERKDRSTAMLLDPAGTVGRLYGAKTTPHLFIVDPDGMLIYAGGIDDRPTTDAADIAGATNYVQAALDAAMAGQPVKVSSSQPYGCSVKY